MSVAIAGGGRLTCAGTASDIDSEHDGSFDECSAVTAAVADYVALIESRDLAGAMTTYDAAGSAARRARDQSSAVTLVSGGDREQLAIAYSDRAELHYLRGRLSRAVADAKRAMSACHLAEIERTSAMIRGAADQIGEAGN